MSVLSHSFGRRIKYAPNDVDGENEDESTIKWERELKEGALNAVQDLQSQLAEAKKELGSLKSDNLVLARTRTIKRLLDNIKIQGTENISDDAVKRAIERGPLITRLRDELNDKNRELAEVTARLAQKEQQLYDVTIKVKRLEVKAEKDLDDSQSHVAEYANRNSELSIKVKKLEQTIIKQRSQITVIRTQITEREAYVIEINEINQQMIIELEEAKQKLIDQIRNEHKSIIKSAQAEAAVGLKTSRSEAVSFESQIKKLEGENRKLESQISQTGALKSQLEEVQRKIISLKAENSTLRAQNDDISQKLRSLRQELQSNTDSTSDGTNYSLILENQELANLKSENRRLKLQLQQLDSGINISANVSTEVNIISNKAERERRIRKLIGEIDDRDQTVRNFLDQEKVTTSIDDEPVAPDYTDSDDSDGRSYNLPSENYLKSNDK